jgi:hypothetical protein
MNAIRLSLLLIVFSAARVCAQEYTLVRSIPFDHARFTTDNMDNVYVIAGNQLLKFDSDGKPVSHFSHINSGSLQSADCSDPLKLVLFYPDFARILTLNNKLSLESTIELRALGFVYPSLVCRASDLGYWVFDLATFQLKKISPTLQVVYESGNLQQLTGLTVRPDHLVEAENFVYLSDPVQGILVFDTYGTYYKTIPLTGVTSLQVRGGKVLVVRANGLFSYDSKRAEVTELKIPAHDALLDARIEQNRLYLLTSTALSIYSF